MHGRHSGTLRRHCGAAASFLATATPPKDCKLQRYASLDLVSRPDGSLLVPSWFWRLPLYSAAFPVGILGMDFLSRFDIELDVPKESLICIHKIIVRDKSCIGRMLMLRPEPNYIYIATKESILYFTSADARK